MTCDSDKLEFDTSAHLMLVPLGSGSKKYLYEKFKHSKTHNRRFNDRGGVAARRNGQSR
jgi:hypothetical protein